MTRVTIKKGREKPLHSGHPWVFSGAIAKVEGSPEPGAIVAVVDHAGGFIASGFYNRNSQIACRLLDWNEGSVIDEEWWRATLTASIERRRSLMSDPSTTAYRLCHAESDGLPGLIVDRYGDYLVLQAMTAGIERVKPLLVDCLQNMIHPRGILERSDQKNRKLEGLPSSHALLSGRLPDGPVEILENGIRFQVDPDSGQKTGFYLDQRINRERVASYAKGADVLDCFSYTGGFALHAIRAGARSVTCVDSSAPAIAMLKRNAMLNSVSVSKPDDPLRAVNADVFGQLRAYRDTRTHFDLVILDPPKLAPTRAAADRAMRSYKDLNLWAMAILKPGGILATFSCSGGVSAERFQEAVWWAAIDAKRDVQIIERLGQGPDHPIRLSFPESEYLKGMVCRVG